MKAYFNWRYRLVTVDNYWGSQDEYVVITFCNSGHRAVVNRSELTPYVPTERPDDGAPHFRED